MLVRIQGGAFVDKVRRGNTGDATADERDGDAPAVDRHDLAGGIPNHQLEFGSADLNADQLQIHNPGLA